MSINSDGKRLIGYDDIIEQARLAKKAFEKMNTASARRQKLDIGSSRAKVTTANAKWTIACEAHWREQRRLVDMVNFWEI